MVQVPAATPVTVLPEIVQVLGVVLENVTPSWDDAVALTVPAVPTFTVGAAPKVMVCAVRLLSATVQLVLAAL